MTTHYQVCSCNGSMPLDAKAGELLGQVLGTDRLPVAESLCRRDVGSLLGAIDSGDQVVVGCTQERTLFAELAQQRPSVSPLRFVNLRESAGWGNQGARAMPKMAALLAAAALPDPEPVPTVDYDSAGRVLVIGPASLAVRWAERLAAQLSVSVLLSDQDTGSPQASTALEERRYPTYSGSAITITGWLGAFTVGWTQHNPIDLETCTRCNACISACPEAAIDFTYQIDADKCRSHGDCVVACGAIGAIDFQRQASSRSAAFDLILDLGAQPVLRLHQPPQGYFAPGTDGARQVDAALALTHMVGQFEKPKFFLYKDKLCAHGRSGKPGCNACIEVCSAQAVSHDGDKIHVDPHLCVGCGACTTVCPTGALAYAYPRVPDMGMRLRTVLATYAKAGGRMPALLLHGHEDGARLIERLGRLAQAQGRLAGMPARVIPVGLHHPASTGIDLWLAAVAWGAANVVVLVDGSEAPQYLQALRAQIAIGQTILTGLGYAGSHLHLLQADTPAELDRALAQLTPGAVVAQPARFNGVPDKRGMLDLAIGHLESQAPTPVPAQIALPAGAPFGSITVDKAACTLCMACVGACPASALMDNADAPQLRFVEKNCVQCGLCEATCPEAAISLTPRLLTGDAGKRALVLNEATPHYCIACNKPFGTAQMINNMLAKLALHGAFAGNTDRLRMCGDCRVVDMMTNRGTGKLMADAPASAAAPTPVDLKRPR